MNAQSKAKAKQLRNSADKAWTARTPRGWSGARRLIVVALLLAAGAALVSTQHARGQKGDGQVQVPTTGADFFQPGTQPEPDPKEFEPIIFSSACSSCHAYYLPEADFEPYDAWVTSMMAQSARDPVWHAALTIANQDANVAGEFCIRCHAPRAWLAGKSTDGTLDDFDFMDFDGVNCNFCHRTVNPEFADDSPPEDADILAMLDFPPDPSQHGNARYVVDPADSRRGPFDDVPVNFHDPVPIIHSPFHQKSEQCATCHDVSNPVFSVDPKTGELVLSDLDQPHPTQDPHDMFPEQRTYSEWLHSDFANGGVVFDDGRFGGNLPDHTPIQSCQDCHMPDVFTGGCMFYDSPPFFPREDMPYHSFSGANTWVLGAVLDQYGIDSGLTEESVAAAQARTVDMLRNASDMELAQCDDELQVRVINMSGHKLPTGYPEGRRMWLNVQYFDAAENLIQEHGGYDFSKAVLDEEDTKVYEVKMGISEDVAGATGLPAGKSFHLALNSRILFDNRIPPMGFTNDAYEAIRAEPVDYTYADGQYWDDTSFAIPRGAETAIVTLYFQTTSREYIEFLRDTNVTDSTGQNAYDLWVSNGMSAPVDMDVAIIDLAGAKPGDANGDGVVDVADLLELLGSWGPCQPPSICTTDFDCSGSTDTADLLILLSNWGM